MYNKNIYDLLEYGRLLKNEIKQLSLDLDNDYLCKNTSKIKQAILEIQEELLLLNKYIKHIDNFYAEDFLMFATKYLNNLGYKYLYFKINMFDYNNYGVKTHHFITDEIASDFLLNNMNCEYDFSYVINSQLLKDAIHVEDMNFSLIDSNFNINHELSKKEELLDPIYEILQMKIDNPSIHNEERIEKVLDRNKKELIKH